MVLSVGGTDLVDGVSKSINFWLLGVSVGVSIIFNLSRVLQEFPLV